MGTQGRYTDRKKVRDACDSILQVIQPGDVVNQVGDFKWWQFWLAIGSHVIQAHHKELFGKKSVWQHDHTMIFFDEDNTFSVEIPRATSKPLETYCLSNIAIYRFQFNPLTDVHIQFMRKISKRMLGECYDVGQLLDIFINGIMGYDHQRKVKVFDAGKKQRVCSVGIRVLFEKLFNEMIRPSDQPSGKWLFDKLNPDKWSQKDIKKFHGTDVEATSPAHFANSDFFQNEFELVARFNHGKKL